MQKLMLNRSYKLMNTNFLEIKNKFDMQLDDMLSLTEKLVNIESGSYCINGVNQIGSILSSHLAKDQFDILTFPIQDRGNLITAFKRLNGHGKLVILGHMDTVWPEGTVDTWKFQYSPDKKTATGPGIGDMKSGLVMAIFVLHHLLSNGFDQLESIKFILVPDEELGSTNSRTTIEEQAKDADIVLVLEPGRPGGGIVGARGALGVYAMDAIGCSAHCATNYHKGASALRELAVKVDQLDSLSDPNNGSIVNVGILRGGTAKQVIPGQAHMEIDLRARTQENALYLENQIKRIARDTQNPKVNVALKGALTRPAFTPTHNRDLVTLAQTIAQSLSIQLFEAPPAGGGSDGNFTAAMNIPTLDGLGPVCHDICSRQETIDIASLSQRAALFECIILALPMLIQHKGN